MLITAENERLHSYLSRMKEHWRDPTDSSKNTTQAGLSRDNSLLRVRERKLGGQRLQDR